MRAKRESIVALLTDFGVRDHYVAAMKGVIASRCDAAIVDLSHEIAPFDVFEAGYFLRCCAPFWESGDDRRIVVVAVIDPGVGTERRILAAHSSGRYFVAPDNGVLSLVLDATAEIVSVEDESLFLPGGSRTFHGRDRFAPVAAALANGMDLWRLGPEVDRPGIVSLDYEGPAYGKTECKGSVVSVDRFGNLVTDLDAATVGPLRGWVLRIGEATVRDVAESYRAGRPDTPFMILGSNQTLEVSVADGDAARTLGAQRGDRVTLRRS